MKVLLADIADLRVGYTFDQSVSKYPVGSVSVLQAKDLANDDWYVKADRINMPGARHHALEEGDIVLSARGSFIAKVFPFTNRLTVPSSSTIIISLKDDSIYPEYLSLYLNSIYGQNQIRSFKRGSIESITKSDLAKVKIPIITLEQQKRLIDASSDLCRYKRLLGIKYELLDKLNRFAFGEAIKDSAYEI